MPRIANTITSLLSMFSLVFISACSVETSGLDDEPVFSVLSKEPVTLRQKFSPAQNFTVQMSSTLTTQDQNESNTDISTIFEMNIEMSMDYHVLSIDGNKNAIINATLKHLSMQINSSKGDNLSYDSSSRIGNPSKFISIATIVDTPIKIKVSATGKIVEFDTTPIEIMMENDYASKAVINNLINSITELNEFVFLTLPFDPVSMNDTFKGPEFTRKVSETETATLTQKFKIGSVSGDQTQIVLIQKNDFKVKSSNKALDIEVLNNESQGWLLFDNERGQVRSASHVLSFDMFTFEGEQESEYAISSKIKYIINNK